MIDPQPPTLGLLQVPRWTHILPIRLLARDRFNPAAALRSDSLNKLFLLPPNAAAPDYISKTAAPAASVHGTVLGDPETASLLQRFVEQSQANGNNH